MDEPSEGLAPTIVDDLVQTIKDLAAGGMGLLVVEQNLGVATSLAERQLVMMTGQITTETTADELANDPVAQRRYLGVEPLPDAA
jgi:branched-chain amino acid transport system ATP-binding protein